MEFQRKYSSFNLYMYFYRVCSGSVLKFESPLLCIIGTLIMYL